MRRDEGPEARRRRAARARIARWLSAATRVSPRAFTAVASEADLPEQVRADSHYWCDEVFAPEANPHDAPGARHGVHRATRRTPDLLRHDYQARGLGLTVIEGQNFVLVRVDPRSVDVLGLPREARAAAVHGVAERLFRTPPGGRALSFGVPAEIDEGACFSTAEDAEPLLLAGWTERVEAGLRGGGLYFLCYKKLPQRVGFASDERWFDEAFRGAPRRRRRRG